MDASEGFLNSIVELARLGAIGVAMFSIFWIGHLITRENKSDAKNDAMHRTLRLFMIYSGCIMVILTAAEMWAHSKKDDETGGTKLEELRKELAKMEELNRVYAVVGNVKPNDGTPTPGGIVFNHVYPDPIVERITGKITSLMIRRNPDGRFPSIGISGERIFPTRLELETEIAQGHITITNSTLILNTNIMVQLQPQQTEKPQ